MSNIIPIAPAQLLAKPHFRALDFSELANQSADGMTWLWEGYLAAGNITLLTSQWKSGKTTLVAVLLARMSAGGTLAGLAVRPGRAVVVSEENVLLWQIRHDKLKFGDNVHLLCRPFLGRPD